MKKQTNPHIKAHLIRSAFYVLLLLAVCVIPFALAQRGASKRAFVPSLPRGTCPTPWELVADMPLDLTYNAGVSDGTYFYSISGFTFSTFSTVTSVYRYNPASNSWDTRADIPLGALGHVAVYYPTTNKIYVFGGEDADGNNFNNTQIYDIATNSWSAGAAMPDLGSFMAGGYVPSTGKIYIISGYNTGFIDSAQPRTWSYDPVANSWTDLTGAAPFPHPAGGFAYGVINNKVYITGGRDANDVLLNLTWEFDPAGPTYTPKANLPGTQPNQAGSAVALNALFVYGGGNPFLAAGTSAATRAPAVPSKMTSAASKMTSGRNNATRVSNKVASDLRKTAISIAAGRAGGKDRPLIPATTNHTWVYNPAADQWTTSANMNQVRSGLGSAFISGSNDIVAAGGYNGSSTATVEVLTPCIPAPTPTPTPCGPTPTPSPPCGLVIGDGLTIGFEPNGYQQIASNIVDYTFSSSVSAPNDYAIFQTHNPWGFTVVADAITAAGHTYSVFTPCDLPGFDFSQYRVVILNWDDTFTSEFIDFYTAALPGLESYSAGGGVVWVQGAIQSFGGDCYPLPFGGQSCGAIFGDEDPIVDICSPMMVGISNPIIGTSASHTSDTGLPAAAHVVVNSGADDNPTLYDLKCQSASPTPTPTPPLCGTALIHNSGFETSNFSDWVDISNGSVPVVTNAIAHSGNFSGFLGGNPPGLAFCGFGNEIPGDSSIYQEFGPVPAGGVLSFWHWDCTVDSLTFDWQDAYITDTSGNILQTVYHQCSNGNCWVNQQVDLSPWVGTNIRIQFLVHQDQAGDLTSMAVDDVHVLVPGPCVSTPTPTPRATPAPRKRPTPPPR